MGGGKAVSGSDPAGCRQEQEEDQEEKKEQKQWNPEKMVLFTVAKALIADQMLTEGIMLLVTRVTYV